MAITKPQLNISEALAFASGEPINKNVGKGRGRKKIIGSTASKLANNSRIFFAPEGDKRLTINLNAELHKKLKIAAIELSSTAGDIIEQLIQKNL